MLSWNGFVEAKSLELYDPAVLAMIQVIPFHGRGVEMRGVVGAGDEVSAGVLLLALDQVIVHLLGTNLMARIVRTLEESRHFGSPDLNYINSNFPHSPVLVRSSQIMNSEIRNFI